jgi:putative phosphoesterase
MNSRKLLVLSDTHGEADTLASVLKWAKNNAVDAAVFLGDGIHDMPRAEAAAGFSCTAKIVRGNSDHAAPMQETEIFDFAGHRFFLCHGHRYSLHNGFGLLVAAARSNEADAALYGHTHVPHCEIANGVFLLNPGSIGRPRSSAGATFAVIECLPEKPLKPVFWNIYTANNTIRQFKFSQL